MVLAEDRILPTKNGRRPRVNDPEGTKRNIVDVATREFAQKGYGGARVDAIAERTRTSKRMIYYYFGGKEGLYLAVLEEAYSSIRRTEATLDSSACRPGGVAHPGRLHLRLLHRPSRVRAPGDEREHHGRRPHGALQTIGRLNVTVIDALKRLIARGQKDGTFRRDIDPIELHMSISALGIFNVANRATFSTIFKRDMASPKALAARRAEVVDIVLRHVRP
jgi:AcrR family transcriptional regulator